MEEHRRRNKLRFSFNLNQAVEALHDCSESEPDHSSDEDFHPSSEEISEGISV